MPEYMQKRFQSHSVRTCLTIVALISYVLTKFSVSKDKYLVLVNLAFDVLLKSFNNQLRSRTKVPKAMPLFVSLSHREDVIMFYSSYFVFV